MAHRNGFALLKLIGLGVLVLGVVAVVLNPSEEKHRSAIYDRGRLVMEEKSGTIGAIVGTVTKSLDPLKSAPIKYNNYYVFSTVTLNDKRMTFGVCGSVTVSDETDDLLRGLLGGSK